jgi:hypothetical protein
VRFVEMCAGAIGEVEFGVIADRLADKGETWETWET